MAEPRPRAPVVAARTRVVGRRTVARRLPGRREAALRWAEPGGWPGLLRVSGRPDPALLPAVLEDVARSLRSGASVDQALAEAARGGDDAVRRTLGLVVDRLHAGDDLATALGWWRDHAADLRVGLPVAALTLAGEAGGSRAWAVDQAAATLRERLALDGELRAQTSQARLSAWILVLSPAAFALLTAAVDGRVAAFLVTSPAGWGCLACGALLDAAGGWWMARVTAVVP